MAGKLTSFNNALWLPPPELKIADWADLYRRISPEASAEPGIWRTSRAEYQREIMNAVSDAKTERIIVMSAAQLGKTEIILNIIGYFIDQEPSPILMLNPTLDMAQSFSKDRLAPMIRDTPCLSGKIQDPRARDSGNTLLHKKFAGGHITMSGANSPASLASRPIRILLCDEVDRYPVSAGTEGDPLSLAVKRTQNFWNRKIIWMSTPTIKGASRIEAAYNEGTREEWCVPCPTCGALNAFDWQRILYKDLREPVMKCCNCGALHNGHEWKAGQNKGRWLKNSAKADELGTERNLKTRSFHLNSFASPWARWADLINQHEEAVRGGAENIKVWHNTVLGLSFELAETLSDDIANAQGLRDDYKAELPDGVLVLTCGVDTQDDRLELEVVGWGENKESWGIEYRVIYGDPGQSEVWEKLDEFLLKNFSYADGSSEIIACTCIDSGGHHTDDVYKFCKGKAKRNIFAIIGRGGQGRPKVNKPSRNNRAKVPLFTLGVDNLKAELYSRLKIKQAGPGACHFPKDLKLGYNESYFKGLLSERLVIRRVRGREVASWEVISRGLRNEPLDARIYAGGALEILNPDFRRRSAMRAKRLKPNTAGTGQNLKQDLKAAGFNTAGNKKTWTRVLSRGLRV